MISFIKDWIVIAIFAAIFVAWVIFESFSTSIPPSNVDKFVGKLVLKDFEGSKFRDFELGEDLKYIDPRGIEWYARAGLRTDGASIPQFLWSVIGSPYTGNYRRAAIMHDWYCRHHYRALWAVSNMFYDAMLTDKVSKPKALLMYYAVVRFGPKWKISELEDCPPRIACLRPGELEVTTATPTYDAGELDYFRNEIEDVRSAIETNKLSKADVEAIALSKMPLQYVTTKEKIYDNWFDFSNRHKRD